MIPQSKLTYLSCRGIEGSYSIHDIRTGCESSLPYAYFCFLCFLGEDQGDVWEPDAGRTSQHCQVPQVLAGHEGESGTGRMLFMRISSLSPIFHTLTPAPPVALRLYSSQNTCHQAASSSFWRKLRKTTRPWMWRSVSVTLRGSVLILCVLWWWQRVLQSSHYSDPYFPQDYRLRNTAGSACSDVYIQSSPM